MFLSSKTGELSSLDDYVSRMKTGQEQVYYLAGESKEVVQSSPLLEKLNKLGYEVLYMIDPIDEYTLANMDKYDGKYKMTNIAKEGLKFDGEKANEELDKERDSHFTVLTTFLKKSLSNKIEKAIVSKRLTQSASALVSGTYGYTANMERILKSQALTDTKNLAFNAPKKIMEINPRHPIVKRLLELVEADAESAQANDVAGLLYDTALLSSGFTIEDPNSVAARIQKMIYQTLDIDINTPVEEEPIPEPEPVPTESTTETTTQTESEQQTAKDEL